MFLIPDLSCAHNDLWSLPFGELSIHSRSVFGRRSGEIDRWVREPSCGSGHLISLNHKDRATSNKAPYTTSNKELLVAPGITRNKKLPETRASLLVTRHLVPVPSIRALQKPLVPVGPTKEPWWTVLKIVDLGRFATRDPQQTSPAVPRTYRWTLPHIRPSLSASQDAQCFTAW